MQKTLTTTINKRPYKTPVMQTDTCKKHAQDTSTEEEHHFLPSMIFFNIIP